MAIYRCEIKPVSRSNGRNAILAACYRAGVALVDACDFFTKEQRRHDYTRRGGVVASGIMLPNNTPAAYQDRQTLWNAQERAENRKNSRVAREAILSLPHELDDAQRQAAVMRYAAHLIHRYGVACDYAVHRPDKGADARNHHAHILFTTRRITPDGLGEKTRELDDKAQGREEIKQMRQTWEHICNEALAEANHTARVDCRSLKDQGIHRLPEPKQGAMATAMERAGRPSHAGEERRATKAYNDALAMMAQQQVAEEDNRLAEPSRVLVQAQTALRQVRRRNQRPAHWFYRRARGYLRIIMLRKQKYNRYLSNEWHSVSLPKILMDDANIQHMSAKDTLTFHMVCDYVI